MSDDGPIAGIDTPWTAEDEAALARPFVTAERLSREELETIRRNGCVSLRELNGLCDTALSLYDENELILTRSEGWTTAAMDARARAEKAETERDAALTQVATLREALGTIVDWSSLKAADHGHVGVREFAAAALAATPGETE